VRTSTREANFGSCETRNDFIEPEEEKGSASRSSFEFFEIIVDSPSTSCDHIASLSIPEDVRFEDRPVLVEIVIRGEEGRNLDILDSELVT